MQFCRKAIDGSAAARAAFANLANPGAALAALRRALEQARIGLPWA